MTAKEHESELADLFTFFETAKFPEIPFKLNKYINVVGNPKVFIASEIQEIEKHKGTDEARDARFRHLRELKAICESQN